MEWISIEPDNRQHHDWVADVWNAACGDGLWFSPLLAAYNMRLTTGALQAGQLVVDAGKPVGFVLASAVVNENAWVDAMAVHPDIQGQGIGSQLLVWAEGWLRDKGIDAVRLGASLRPFVPGVPVELGSEDFFRKRGYELTSTDVDMACDLAYGLKVHPVAMPTEVLPLTFSDVPALHEFLQRAFPGRWHFEFEEFLREAGHLSDYRVLWASDSGTRRIEGFCQTTWEDSVRPMERFYPQPLPRPWGQLGSIGVSEACRGKGYAATLINAALERFRAAGVRGCIIDWTGLIDLYARFGFTVHRRYSMMRKTLIDGSA